MNPLMKGGVAFGAGTLALSYISAALGIVFPPLLLVTGTLAGVGLGIAGIALNKDELEEFFRIELSNPAIDLISTEKKEYGEIHYLTIPLGMKEFDYDKYAKKLADNFKRSVKIEREDNKIKVVVYSFGYMYDSLADMERGVQDCLKAACLYAQGFAIEKLKIFAKEEYNNGFLLYVPHVPGISSDDFNKAKKQLKEFFNGVIDITYSDKFIVVDVYTKKLEDKYPYQFVKTESPTEILVGPTVKEMKVIDIKNGNILVGGTTGSGKSTWERSAIVNLILNNYGTDNIWLNLHDSKLVEYGIFKDCSLVNKFTTSAEDFYKLLEKLKTESMKRYDLFRKENILDITQWNREHPDNKLRYIITFIAEFAQLAGHDKAMNLMRSLLEVARASGEFFVVSTQRPSKDLLPTNIKCNLDTRISFRTADSTNAWIILDQDNTSENIKIKGRGILKVGGEMEDFHGMMMSSEEAINLVKHTFKQKKEE